MTADAPTGALEETLAVFREVTSGTPLTTVEAAERLDIGRRSCYYRLDRLAEQGLLETKRVGNGGRVWWRPVEGESVGGDHTQFDTLVDAVEEYAIFSLDPEGYVRTWNEGAARIKGYDISDIVGEHVSVFYTEADRETGVPSRNLRAARESGSVEDEGWRVRDDGTRFWAKVTISARRDEVGPLLGYTKVTRDMTDRREREQALRRERDHLEQVLETSPIGIGVFDTDGSVIRANDRFSALLGRDDPETYELGDQPLFDESGEEIPYPERPAPRVLEHGETVTDARIQVPGADGETRWLSVNAAPLSGETEGVVATMVDVTRLKEQAAALRRQRDELELELEEVFERVDDGFLALDETFRLRYVTDGVASVAGCQKEELLGESVWEVFPEARVPELEDALCQAFETQTVVSIEPYLEPFEGWYAVTIYPSETGLSVYYEDVTARKRRERELERYETIVETVGDGIYAVDEDARFVLVNEAFCALTGRSREELLGSHATTVHAAEITPLAERLVGELAADQRSVAHLDLDVHTKAGEQVPCECRLAPFPMTDGSGRCGVVRDVSVQRERQRRLERRVRQQAAVADLGTRALEGPSLDVLFDEAVELVAETLEFEYCKVLELMPDGDELLLRSGVGWQPGYVGTATVETDYGSQAGYTLLSEDPVVVEEMATETRFEGPDLLLDHGVESGISVVIGSPAAPWGVLGTHDTDPHDLTENDAHFVQSVANVLATAIDRRHHEADLERQRERLAALNDLNGIVRGITEAVVEQSTREEVERTVCERLADSESYLFAWVGDVDNRTETVRLRCEAGVEGYLDDITISVDPDDERSGGPTGQAVLTLEMQVQNDVGNSHTHDPWREHVADYGFSSSAAIPIQHEDTLYGVLNVYAERPHAFESEERDVLSQLGEVIGHAIASLERKRALMSDDLVELELRLPQFYDVFNVEDPGVPISFERAVPLGDGRFFEYGSAPEGAAATLDTLVGAVPHWTEWTAIDSGGEHLRFELQLSEPPILSTVADHGGRVAEARIEGGDLQLRLQLPYGADVQAVVDALDATYPGIQSIARRQVTRERVSTERLRGVFEEDLTERQQTVLRVAYLAGFYEWPRHSSSRDIADSLGVNPSTVTEHIRKAENRLLGALFEEPAGSRSLAVDGA